MHPLPPVVCLVPNNFATTLCIRWGSSVIETEEGPRAVHSVLMEEPGLHSGLISSCLLHRVWQLSLPGFMLHLMHAAV